MTMTLSERLVSRISTRSKSPTSSRRGFLGGAALVGAALAADPWGFLVRPASAYASVCGTDSACGDGYSVFCCTINGGKNSCPPNSFIGGWWKADNSSFCGGAARYYIDCNAYRDGAWHCHCAEGTCDQRRVACNQFRYGQCSLQIPASQTGPVVCRMVSCTPPWQQFGGTCTSSSATDNRTATHSAPCVGGRNPVGSLDVLSVSGDTVHLRGWAFDPDRPGSGITVSVHRDGVGVGRFGTGVRRSDINRVYGITGDHGYSIALKTGPGKHTFGVYGINLGGGSGNPLIGSGSVTVGSAPRGSLDSVVTGPNSTIRVRGWAYDPDQPAAEIKVAVYRDDVGLAWFPTGRRRSDVNSTFGITGHHGFDISIPSPPGNHSVRVYAINVAGGAGNPLLGKRQVRVGVPMGHLDSALARGGSVRLRGWAFDPDQPATAINVAVYRDGNGVSRFPTGRRRPDVNSVFGVTGNHGFDISIPSPSGRHTFEVFAINVGPASGNPLVGTRAVQVAPS